VVSLDLVIPVTPAHSCHSRTLPRACETQQARLLDVVDARMGDEEELTRPNRVVCADTAAKGVSAGSAESMIGDRRRGWIGARCAEEQVLLRQAGL